MKKLTVLAIALLALAPACCFRKTCKEECVETCVQEEPCDGKTVRRSWTTKTESCGHDLNDEDGVEYHRKTVVRKS